MADKWEYKIEPISAEGGYPAEKWLNDLGKDGWELVSVTRFYCVFKRKL